MKKSFVEQNPNTVAAVQCARLKGTEQVKNKSVYTEILKTDLGLNEQALANDVSPDFGAKIRKEPLQMNADMLRNIGAIDEDFEVASITVPTPENCG